MSRPKLPLPIEEIAEKYATGRTLRHLGLSYGTAPNTIANHLRAHGVQLRPPTSAGKRYGWQPNRFTPRRPT